MDAMFRTVGPGKLAMKPGFALPEIEMSPRSAIYMIVDRTRTTAFRAGQLHRLVEDMDVHLLLLDIHIKRADVPRILQGKECRIDGGASHFEAG